MTDIVPTGRGQLLTARGNVMAFKAVAAQTGGDLVLQLIAQPVQLRCQGVAGGLQFRVERRTHAALPAPGRRIAQGARSARFPGLLMSHSPCRPVGVSSSRNQPLHHAFT